jgi:hypothetical protein
MVCVINPALAVPADAGCANSINAQIEKYLALRPTESP